MQLNNITPYQQTLHTLSERIVEAQRPIRILNSLKWPQEVQTRFFEQKCKKLPEVTLEMYQKISLPFDPEQKKEEFYAIERDIREI